MWRPGWRRSVRTANVEPLLSVITSRDRAAIVLALVTSVSIGVVFTVSKGTSFLMPGPLTSAHGGIEKCTACHSKSGNGKLNWTHGLVVGDPIADSKACLTCHKMPDTAFNPHSASAEILHHSNERLSKIAATTPQPQSANAQNIVFPTHDLAANKISCATCHQEHQGIDFKLNNITSEQCRSCHVVKFDSFNGHHPNFENYPFKRRTRLVYDHAGHFGKHYPEVAKKYPDKRIPATCSTCHNSSDDKRIMAVQTFDKTCSSCHLDQIVGKERVSGPKGIAFLTLPGLDLATLKKKNAAIGEWPDASDAALTPFMQLMISRSEAGRSVLKAVQALNLQDLSAATDDQMQAVTNLVWEIKRLFHALIAGKALDVLGDLNIGRGAKLSPALVADLTASIPRDVVSSAQQQWLPNLAAEITDGPNAVAAKLNNASIETAPPTPPESGSQPADDAPETGADETKPDPSAEATKPEADAPVKRDPQPCVMRVFGQCLISQQSQQQSQQQGEAAPSNKAADAADSATAQVESGKADNSAEKSPAKQLPPAMRAGLKFAENAAPSQASTDKKASIDATHQEGKKTRQETKSSASESKSSNQNDDLLFPTEAELRELNARGKNNGGSEPASGASGVATRSNMDTEGKTQTTAAPVISIDSGVDPESWAEYGGWYRQDYAIFYRPIGHKDKFVYAWLFLTGPQAPKGDVSPAAAVFDTLTHKDAQGSCTKCHSVDDLKGKGRVVNFSPPSADTKLGRFTKFVHEPHFSIMDNRGCLTCHNLEKGRPYLKSYEQGNPQSFEPNFAMVKKDTCHTCHNGTKARQDCLLCHTYHVSGSITPIMQTKLPTQ